VTDYLYLKKKSKNVSKTFFILIVHALRAACKVYDLPYEHFKLPKFPNAKKLPVVLNMKEAKALLIAVAHYNKVYALIIALMLDCGLRISEVPALEVGDIDFERSRLHVRESKRNKDRCIPTSKGVLGKLKTHLDYWSPQKFVFEDLKCSGRAIPIAGINQVLKAAVKAAGITKNVKGDLVFTTHTSRKNIFFYGSTMQ
jgi:integrase